MAELEPGSFPARHHEPRSLMSRPQRLGILPTLWFWREVRTERPLIGMLTGLAMGVFSVVMGALVLEIGLNLAVAFVVALCLPVIGLGLVERGLRCLVIRQRRMLAQGEPPG